MALERRRRNIPPFQPRWPKVVWTGAMLRLLGKIADGEIARRFGIGEDAVRRERRRRGIAPIRNVMWKVLRKRELRRLLRLQTNEVVRRTGLNEKTVLQLRKDLGMPQPGLITGWTPAVVGQLGKVPDGTIAARLGITPAAVRLKRYRLGISLRPWRRPWTPREDALVRRLPLGEAAKATRRTIKAIRHRLSRQR